jgi:hypothetical protein
MSEDRWCPNCGVPMYDAIDECCSLECAHEAEESNTHTYSHVGNNTWRHDYCGEVVHVGNPQDIVHDCPLLTS